MVDLDIPKHTVIQYVRDKKRIPRGVIVAVKHLGLGFICGYSLCNKKDRFSKKMALKIAIGRANNTSVVEEEVPHEVRKVLPSFIERCKKYYKD
jgi:hypothetical protein